MSPVHLLMTAVLAVAALGACGEKAPRTDPEKRHANRSNDVPQHSATGRTLHQGEYGRISE
jgi:predicted small lipoprotein YifL